MLKSLFAFLLLLRKRKLKKKIKNKREKCCLGRAGPAEREKVDSIKEHALAFASTAAVPACFFFAVFLLVCPLSTENPGQSALQLSASATYGAAASFFTLIESRLSLSLPPLRVEDFQCEPTVEGDLANIENYRFPRLAAI